VFVAAGVEQVCYRLSSELTFQVDSLNQVLFGVVSLPHLNMMLENE
jgi:hypothetical protein